MAKNELKAEKKSCFESCKNTTPIRRGVLSAGEKMRLFFCNHTKRRTFAAQKLQTRQYTT